MDTSEQYILMCQKANKIQDLACFSDGDFFIRPGQKIHEIYDGTQDQSSLPSKWIWLPRQDQLQQTHATVIEGFEQSAVSQLALITQWMFKEGHKFHPKVTMEQLWLIYVMYDVYDLRWTGEDWVTIEPISDIIKDYIKEWEGKS